MKVCIIQMNSRDDKEHNLVQTEALLHRGIAATAPDLVVLPELWTYLGGTPEGTRNSAETLPGGPAYSLLQGIAREYGVYLHGGSINECDGSWLYNTSLVFDPSGAEIARYRKIHLFDVVTPDGKVFKESATYHRGGEIVTCKVGDYTLGCSVCYDLRFPELYAALRAADVDIIVVPAAFTLMTGKDHWEVLCRARALETQTYLLASNQDGVYVEAGSERACYGHSMVVDPWGTVLARAQAGSGYIEATLNFDYMRSVRANLPCNEHHVLIGPTGGAG